MKISCEVIRDLLPLYHDAVCSDESKSLVEEHLKTCEGCAEELRRMGEELTAPHIPPENESARKAVSSAWKKAKKKSFAKGILLTVLICAALAGILWGLTQWKVIPVPTDVLEVTQLSRLSDGGIVFHLFVNDAKELYFIKFTATDDGCFYLTPMRSVIESPRRIHFGLSNRHHIFYPPGYGGALHPGGTRLPEHVTRIYVGPVGAGLLVWDEEMVLPEASGELEEYLSVNS